MRYQFRSQLKTSGIVECQNSNRRAAGWRHPFDMWSIEPEVSGPFVAPRMKKSHYFSGGRVDPCHIRTLAKITPMASKRKIVDVV